MMVEVNLKYHMLLMIYVCIQCNECASVTDINGTKPVELNGKKLSELGIKLNLPKLLLIGKAIENIEGEIDNRIQNIEKKTAQKICKLNPCLEWSAWSKCSSNVHLFGFKSRARECSLDKTTCKFDTTNSKIEKENGICGGFCPQDYTETKKWFCLKIYKDKFRTKDSAELQCKEDGGHLINIDSEIKYEDVQSLSKINHCFWIDGRRKNVSSPWRYTYGTQKGFFKWSSRQPDNSASDLCLCLNRAGWYDTSCTTNRYSICEITLTT